VTRPRRGTRTHRTRVRAEAGTDRPLRPSGHQGAGDLGRRRGAVCEAYTGARTHRTPIHPGRTADVLDDVAADDAIFTVDTGMNNVWAARYITPNGRRRVIGSFLQGTMANALPHAIGAAFAHPGRQVIAMCGDGGLSMLLGELLTVTHHDLPVTIVVFNNSSLGMVELEMLVQGVPPHGTDLGPVYYADIAAAAGMRSIRVTDPGQVRPALADALSSGRPALVDLVTDPLAPHARHITGQQVRGFATAAGKTILDGGVGRMLHIARSNLRNLTVL
jgi:pyruvate dehydrogenase (quinone)